MNERSGRGWWREMRGSRPTSSENSSPAEFLISPRHPHLRGLEAAARGGKRKVQREEREEKGVVVAEAEVEKEQAKGGWGGQGGAALSCARFSQTFPPPFHLSLSLSFQAPPRSAHTLPRVATSRLHPLAPTERENGSGGGGGGGGGGDGGGSVFLITTAIFFSSRDDAAAKRYRNISPPINPVVTSSENPCSPSLPSIDRWNVGFDRADTIMGRDHRVGWTGVIARFISFPCYEIGWPLRFEDVKSLEVFLGPREGGWRRCSSSGDLGRVSKSGLRVYTYIYARKKRWSEEGYVRMSGMGLWNRWMGDDTLLFPVSACATRAMIGFERQRHSCSKVAMYRVIDHHRTCTSFNSPF